MVIVKTYLALGSNLGDRIAHLADAERRMSDSSHIKILNKSQIYETEPWPLREISDPNGRVFPKAEGGQGWFLNQVALIETDFSPFELLKYLQSIEKAMGRLSKGDLKPREIDIDILLYGDQVIESSELTIPHRHMTDRQFVLVPLLEIAPDLKDPVSGKTYRFFLSRIKDKHKVEPFF